MKTFTIILLILMLLTSACQSLSDENSLPTRAQLPTITPKATEIASHTPTIEPSATITVTPSMTITDTPSATMQVITLSPTITLAPLIQPIDPIFTPTPLPRAFRFGQSSEGRDLNAYAVGAGAYTIVIVGGIHAGFEANTIDLVNELYTHFQRQPTEILPNVQLLFIPMLNPDGVEYGRQIRGRFNGNGVDLNRNWACGWSETAEFSRGTVNPGDTPFSEPESLALASLIEAIQPRAVIFYHAAVNGVFSGDCGGDAGSVGLAQAYGDASNYPYGSDFEAYDVTGSAPAWVNSIGIPAIDVELATAQGTEFSRNRVAINAIQQWIFTQR